MKSMVMLQRQEGHRMKSPANSDSCYEHLSFHLFHTHFFKLTHPDLKMSLLANCRDPGPKNRQYARNLKNLDRNSLMIGSLNKAGSVPSDDPKEEFDAWDNIMIS